MPYSVVEEKLHTIPEEYLPQIMDYLCFLEYKVLYKNKKIIPTEEKSAKISPDFDTHNMQLSDFFGSVSAQDSDKMLEALKDCSNVESTNEW